MNADKNKKLMLDCGSKTGAYDAEAPDQWKYVLRYGDTEQEAKGMAWIKSKTTAWKHESPYCVDEHDNPLYIQHMAVECGWKEQTARNVLTTLQNQGRARFGKGRIWYCADIPQVRARVEKFQERPEESTEIVETEGRTKGDESNSVQSYFPTYVADFIEKLPKEKRLSAVSKWEANLKWRREFFADTMAAARVIADRVEDTTLLEIGLPKKRLPIREKPAAETKTKWVQIKLFEEPNFVQSCDLSSYKVETDFVDARAFRTAATPAKPLARETPPTPPPPPAPPINKSNHSSSSAVSSKQQPQKAEEEESQSLYQTFKIEYPAGHFDEPKTKPSFEKKTKTQQHHIIDRLRVYLDCERWKDAGGKWIPLSSTWLATYEADPPPALKKTLAAGAGAESELDRRARKLAQEHEEEKKWR